MNPTRNKRAPKRTTRFIDAKAGSPKSREAQGDGTPIRVSHKNRTVPKGNKGAAHEDGPECVIDTHTQGRYQEVSKAWRYAKLQTTEALLGLLRERGKRGLPLQRIYRQLYNTNLYLTAYGRIYRNAGAMTPAVTDETAPRWKPSLPSFKQCGKNGINGNQPEEPSFPRKTGRKGRLVCPSGATNSWLR